MITCTTRPNTVDWVQSLAVTTSPFNLCRSEFIFSQSFASVCSDISGHSWLSKNWTDFVLSDDCTWPHLQSPWFSLPVEYNETQRQRKDDKFAKLQTIIQISASHSLFHCQPACVECASPPMMDEQHQIFRQHSLEQAMLGHHCNWACFHSFLELTGNDR